ncbi:MAG: hypothetical protein ACR2OR_14055 [Hyphomicrobiales bacterium]
MTISDLLGAGMYFAEPNLVLCAAAAGATKLKMPDLDGIPIDADVSNTTLAPANATLRNELDLNNANKTVAPIDFGSRSEIWVAQTDLQPREYNSSLYQQSQPVVKNKDEPTQSVELISGCVDSSSN